MRSTSRKLSRFQVRSVLAFAVAGISAVTSQALADRTKADNSTDLNVGTSWVGGIAPGSGDVAIFDATGLSLSSYALNLGANQSWLGLKLINFGTTTSITINGTSSLTLGASGIDTSGGGMALNLNNNLVLGASQTWNMGFSGSITVGGATNLSANTLTLSGFSLATFTGALTNGTLINNGVNASLSGNDNLTQIVQSGSGFTTLSGNRSVGTVTLYSGNLNLASAGALGGGKFVLAGSFGGGSFDNVSGSDMTLNAVPVVLAGAGSYQGNFNNLDLGSGGVTLTADSTLGVFGHVLTISSAVNTNGFALNLASSSGTLLLNPATNIGGKTLTLSGSGLVRTVGVLSNGTVDVTGNASISGADNVAQVIVDGGAAWLSGNRTVGTVTVANGVLNIASAGALGSGKLLLTGGGFDNVAAGPLTLNAIPITLNGASSFVGTNSLNMGNGTFNLSGSSTLTLNNGLLTIANNIAGNNNNLTIGGGFGTVALSGNNTFGTGTFTLAGGVLNINSTTALQDGTFLISGGVLDNGTGLPQTLNTVPVRIGGTLTFGGTNNLTVNSAVTLTGSDGTIYVNAKTLTIAGNIGNDGINRRLIKDGPGVLVLSGSDNWGNGLTLIQGTLSVTGYLTTRANTAAQLVVGNTSGVNAVLSIDGGTVTSLDNSAPAMDIGTGAGTVGVLKLNSGVFIETATETWVSNVSGAYGAIIVNGGTLSTGFIGLGRSNTTTTGSSIMNVKGGVVNATQIIAGSYPSGVTDAASHAVATFSGGTVNTTGANMFAAQQVSGMINIMGTALVLAPAMEFANVATTTGEVNLNGGTLSVNGGMVFDAGNPIFNLNGGKLISRSAITLIPSSSRARVYVWGGGAIIDDNGFADTIAQPLIAPFGNGVTSISLDSGIIGGFVAEPMVILTGGGGTGATAIAVLDISGNVTGFQVTNPGVGYTSAPFVTVTGGGQNFVSGTASIGPNVGGGLTKLGAGTLTLNSVNTYAGNTVVGNGTLLLNFNTNATISANIINPSTTLVLNGTAAVIGATLVVQSNQASSRSQTFASTIANLGNGPSNISVAYTGTNSAAGVTVNLGSVTRSGFGASLSLNNTNTLSVASGFTAITANANFAGGQPSILNGWVVFNGSSGLMTWASSAGNGVTAGAVTPLTTFDSAFTPAKDILAPVGNFTTSASLTINSLRFANVGASTINAAGGLTIATGGIMVTPTDTTAAHPLAINNGTLTSGNGVDLLVWQNNTVNSLTINSAITGNIGVTKIGSGSLILSSAASSYLGKTYVYSGTLAIVADASLGTAPGTATADALDYLNAGTLQFQGNVNLAANRGVKLNGNLTVDTGTNNTSIGGIISANSGVGSFGITKTGAGVLTLSNLNTYTGATIVRAGSLVLTGSILTDAASFVTISDTANTNAVVLISGGTLSALKTTSPSLRVGTVAGSAGAIRMTSGAITTASQFQLGQGAGTGAYAALTMTGGAVTSGDWLVVGFNNDRAAFNMGGGSFTVAANRMTVGAGGTGSLAVVNFSGGTFSSPGGIFVGETGTAVVNQFGGAVTSGNIGIGQNAGANGALNLLGGTLSAASLSRGGGTARVNFNGGLLKATANSGAFLSSLTNAYVYGGNANIDDGGFDIVAGQGLEAPTGQGIGTITMTGGTGFIDTPIVTIIGSGTGATAIANINYATGALTGITITNPGIGYSGATTVTLSGGGFGSGGAATSSVLYSANTIGGLNKSGAGTLTLSSTNNTFTGPTNVNAGALQVTGSLAGAVNVNSSSRLIMGTGGLISNTVLLSTGTTLSAVGLASTITGLVTGSGNNLITMVDNLGGGVLNLSGGLSIGSGTPMKFDVDGAFNAADKIVVGGAGLTGAGTSNVMIFLNNLGGLTPGQVYTLASYTGANPSATLDGGSTQFGLDTVTLLAAGGSITITVNGPATPASAYWTGQFGANWNDLSGPNTNFNDTNTANHNSGQVPGATTSVIFDASVLPPIANLNTVLNSNWDVKNISVNANMTSGVFISSSTSAANTLILETGLNNASGAGLTINANVVLNQSQTWSNSAGLITVNGVIAGGSASQLDVTGQIALSGNNTFTGGTAIGAGTVTAGSSGALASGSLSFVPGLGGHLQVNGNSVVLSGLSGDSAAIIENSGASNGTLTFTSTGASVFAGTLQNGGTANTLALLVTGGILNLAGTNTYTGLTTARGGSLVLTGAITTGGANAVVTVGDTANTKGAMVVNGGTLAANVSAAPSIRIGAVANGIGALTLNSGIITTASEVWIAAGPAATDAAASSYGALLVNGGTITTGSYLAVARGQAANSSGVGLLQVTGGVVNVNGGNLEVGSFQGTLGQLHGVAVITGGAVGVRNILIVGQGNSAIVNMMGGVATAGTTTIANTAAQTGILNLDGGTLTSSVGWSAGVGTLNFNGGTLKALPAGSTTLLASSTVGSVYVWSNGAILDDSGRTVTVAANLLTPGTSQGVASFVVTNGGSGFIAPPVVRVNAATTGTTGTGASAIAIMNGDSIGTITITNPGIGYNNGSTSNFPSVTLIGGGGTGAVIAAGTLATTVSGGLTKVGTGTVTLSSTANTFTGNTNINAGVLYVSGSLRTSPVINANGGGALGGTGTVGGAGTTGALINLAAGSSAATQGAINLQDNLAGTLTLTGSLTATGTTGNTSNLLFDIGGGVGDRVVLGGNPFVTNAANTASATIYLTSLSAEQTGQTYTVMTYTNATAPNVVLNSTYLAFNAVHLLVSNSSVNVVIDSVPAAPATAYFSANASTGIWNTVVLAGSTPIGNWNTGVSNGIPVTQLPGPNTDVFLGTTSPNNINTLNSTLGQIFDIKSLTVTGNLSGGAILNGNALVVEGGGITVDASSGGLTLNSAVVLNASQSWSNNNISIPLTVGGVISSPVAVNLTKSGGGNLQLNAANTFSGTVTLAGGTVALGNAAGLGASTNTVNFVPGSNAVLQIVNLSPNVGGLAGGDNNTYIENGGTAGATLILSPIASNTFGGVIRDGFGGGTVSVRVTGGTQSLTNAQTYTGTTVARNGTLVFKGGTLASPALISAGDTAAQVGVLVIDNGIVSANSGNADTTDSLIVGSVAGAIGDLKVLGGTLSTNFRLRLGTATGAYAGMSVSGGTVTIAQSGLGQAAGPMFWIGSTNDRAIVNLSGGYVASPKERVSLGTGGNGGIGVLNITGGTLDIQGSAFNDSLLVGENSNALGSGGILSVSGTGVLTMFGNLDLANNANTAGIANLLSGGTIIANSVGARSNATGISTWNFNGGTLKAATTSTGAFLRNMTNAFIYGNGAIIDDSGTTVTVSQILQAPTGNGVTDVGGTFATTSGFVDTPVVIVIGGGGAGATAVANITNGSISSFTVTNPGTGYTSNPTVTVFGGGGAPVAGATVGTLSLASNIQTGGLTKLGTGTTTLSGANTFQGSVVVNAGTLLINSNANLGSSVSNAPVNINNGATLSASTTTTISHPLVLGAGGGAITAGTAGILTLTGAISGSSLSLSGGTINLNGANTYTGDTSISGGLVRVNGALSGAGTVNVLPAGILPPGKLGGTGSIAGPVVVSEGAELNFLDGTSGTLTLSNGLNIGGAFSPSYIRFELGSFISSTSVDSLALGSSALTVNGGGASITLTSFGISAGTYTLARYGSIGGAGTLALDAGSTQVGASTASLITNGTSLQLIIVGAAIPINAYWTGNIDGNWNSVQSGSITNFNTTALGTLNTFQTPGAVTNLFFANATTGTTFTNLGQDTGINSLTVLSATINSITINGNNTSGTPNTLYIGAGGINVQSGSGGIAINANVGVVASQSWINNSSIPLSVGGNVSGTGDLTLAGNGGGITLSNPIDLTGNILVQGPSTVTLAAANTFSGSLGITGSGTVILGAANSFNGLVMSGTGQLQLNGNNSFTGNVALNSGTITLGNGGGLGAGANLVNFASNSNAHLQLNGFSATIGGISGDSTAVVENFGGGAATLIINSSAANTYNGILQDGGGAQLNLRLQGGGSLTLTNSNNSYTGTTVVRSGKLFLTTGMITSGSAGNVTIGDGAGQTGVFILNGGTVTANATSFPSTDIGVASGAVGVLQINSGLFRQANGELDTSNVAGAYGAIIVTGGTLSSGFIGLGRTYVGTTGSSVMKVTGGLVTTNNGEIIIGSYGAADSTVIHAVAIYSGGTITTGTSDMFVGQAVGGILNISGTAVVSSGGGQFTRLSDAASQNAEVNLNGGTLTSQFVLGAGNGIVNFNGGTMSPVNNLSNLTPATGNTRFVSYVWGGGATIDDTGLVTTISASLLAPSGNGVTAVSGATGSGYLADPMVILTGGGGTGATAIAVLDISGNLTGFQVTNPGVGYTSAPTVTVSGGGGSLVGNATASFAANGAAGALTKLGLGTLILTNANTYAGTTISAGTLQIGNGGITGSLGTGAVVNNAGLVFNLSNAYSVSNDISGSGTVSLVAGTSNTDTMTYTGSDSAAVTSIDSLSTLRIGNAGAAGALSSPTVIDNGTLAFNRTGVLLVGSAISGSGAVSQIGAGTTTLTGANNYSGPTTISAGTLMVGNGGATGSLGSGIVTNAGVLAFNVTGTNVVANVISGAGTLNQMLGTTVLTATNTMSGPVNITGGVLQVGNGGATGSLGTSNVANAATLTLNRTGTLAVSGTVTGSGALNNTGAGTATLANYQGTGAVSVTAGTLAFGTTAGTRHTPAVLVQASAATVASGATLDLTNHDLLIHGGSAATVESLIGSSYFFGLWNKPGITSSSAQSNPITTLGIMSGADYNTYSTTPGVFDGVPVANTDIVVKYTYSGDINLDGLVNDDDFGLFSGAYFFTGVGNYALGDLNFDGLVNDDDFGVFSGNYFFTPPSPLGGLGDTSLASASASGGGSAPVPEPASLVLLGLGATALLSRRKNRRRI